MKAGGSATKGTHVTKEGKTAKKGLWYNIHQKRKRGGKPRKPGSKGAPTAKAFRESAKTAKKMKSGGFIAKGCGKVMPNRRKLTKIY